MTDEGRAEWAVVWEQAGHGADIDADLAMSLLEGSGLPVRRIPDSAAPVLFDGFGGPMMPVRLLVPTEREAEARELLAEFAEHEPDPADDPAQWVVAATFRGEQQEMEADLAVTTLHGAGVPARRSPEIPTTMVGDNLRGLAILVPPGRRSEARDLLADQLPLPGKSTPLERFLLRALLVVTALGALRFALEFGGAWGAMGYTVKDWALGTPFERQLPVVTHYWPAVVMGLMMLLWFAWMVARGRRRDGSRGQ